jgi:hypothetical protein
VLRFLFSEGGDVECHPIAVEDQDLDKNGFTLACAIKEMTVRSGRSGEARQPSVMLNSERNAKA